MASQQLLDQMKQVLENLKSVDKDRLLRPALGEESLEQAGFTSVLNQILGKASFALEYGKAVDESVFSSVINTFSQLHNLLSTQAKRANAEYVSQRTGFTTQVTTTLQQVLPHWTHFVSAAVEARGFLEDEGIRKEYRKTVEEMKSQAEGALRHVREESQKVLDQATKLAKDIEERARRTAAHISVEEAQKQFKEAQAGLDGQVKLWAWLSVGSLAAFLLVAFALSRVVLPDKWQWHVVYYTAIRVTILTAVGAAARVANSMQAFVEDIGPVVKGRRRRLRAEDDDRLDNANDCTAARQSVKLYGAWVPGRSYAGSNCSRIQATKHDDRYRDVS